MSKALLSQQVLTLWLFSKVGTPKRVKPTEGNRTSTTNANATMIVCANRVEGIPGYCEPILRGWLDCSQGISENDALIALMEFFKALEESLRILPIFPVEANEIVTEIASYTLREIAAKLNPEKPLNPKTVKFWMEDEGFKVPGVFQFEKHWKIMNMDALKNAYQEKSTINIEIAENICVAIAS